MAASAPAPRRVPRDPSRGVLHRVLRAELGRFFARVEADPLRRVPSFVRRELEGYLRCGVPGAGFARLRCRACGLEELVYFSCKGRGFCPSCGGRRMASLAAHLVEQVLPRVAVRQWVFTLPFELRTLAAWNVEVLNTIRRIYWQEAARWLRRRGREAGLPDPRPGGVTFLQRFDSALRLNPHAHSIILSGVYDGESGAFHPLPAPGPDDLAAILHRISFRLTSWLVAAGYLDPGAPPEETGEEEGLPPEFTRAAVTGGSALGARAAARWVARLGADPHAQVTFTRSRRSAMVQGFSLYVGPSIAACARQRLEQLCRCPLSPPSGWS